VAATAGPNFESILAAMGSGAAARSKDHNKTIISCDIGGGTSNIAAIKNGQTVSTSCISVGGRLLGVSAEGKIWRIDKPAQQVMQHLGLNYKIGDRISQQDIKRISAAVIGAGAYSLSISGSSCFMDDQIAFPIRNVPVIRVDIDRSKLSFDHILEQINISFQRFDLKEGEEIVALYFKDPVMASYPQLELFARSIEAALDDSIEKRIPIILIFETDIACGVGNVIRRETRLKTNLLTIDELTLKEGDWVDIGEPLVAGQVFPVTVKSLVFH